MNTVGTNGNSTLQSNLFGLGIDAAVCNNSPVWHEIKALLNSAVTAQVIQTEEKLYLNQLMLALQQQLEEDAQYLYALHLASSSNRDDVPWTQQPLFRDGNVQLELITFFKNYNTPIHDYPSRAGVCFIVEGDIAIQHYENALSPISSQYPISKLIRMDLQQRRNCEIALLLPWENNIQEIRSLAPRSIVLRATMVQDPQPDCHWYFPISARDSSHFFVQRLKRLH
ncbi:hypothetical protein [Kaarinaea lacus]